MKIIADDKEIKRFEGAELDLMYHYNVSLNSLKENMSRYCKTH
jgi:hypothetical protein